MPPAFVLTDAKFYNEINFKIVVFNLYLFYLSPRAQE